MIAKARAKAREPRRKAVPIDVRLTVSFRFGDEPADHVTVMNDRRIPLIGSVFDSRDAILRGFSRLVLKASLRRPQVAAELLPVLKLLPHRRGKKKQAR